MDEIDEILLVYFLAFLLVGTAITYSNGSRLLPAVLVGGTAQSKNPLFSISEKYGFKNKSSNTYNTYLRGAG